MTRSIHTKKEAVVEDEVKARKGRVEEGARCEEEKPAVEFRFFAPGNGQREEHGESNHVVERNAQEGGIGLMKLDGIEPAHDDGYRETQRDHQCAEDGAKPTEEAVPRYVVRTHECRLKDVEGHPSGECEAMNPEKERPRQGGVEQALIHGATETGNNDRSEQQGHEEIEIPVQ